jgi:hypothetical protein
LVLADVIDLEVHFLNFKEDAMSREELAAAGGLAPAVRLWMCLAQLANEDGRHIKAIKIQSEVSSPSDIEFEHPLLPLVPIVARCPDQKYREVFSSLF